jgi:subtilisin
MLHDDPKICTEKSPLDFLVALKAFKRTDESLYQLASHQFNKQRWRALIKELHNKRPELELEFTTLIKAGAKKERTTASGVIVRDRMNEIAQELLAAYKCDSGLVETPQKRTATVFLKHPQVITGLPREIIRQSDNLARDHGGKRKWTFGFDNRTFTVALEDAAIEELRNNPLVEKVEISPLVQIMAGEIPTYNPAGINTDWGVSRLFPAAAWAKNIYGQGIKLLVADTGIQKNHPVFWKDGQSVYKGGWNFVGDTNDPEDDHDHGTYCCSIIAAQHNNVPGSYRGIAPGIDLYACKILDSKGSGQLDDVAAALDWARTNGMHVVSMSLGANGGTTTMQAACDAAWYAGIILLTAAGNSGPGDNTVNWPAKYTSCVAVAAVDHDENVADYSSRGPEVELAAPGSQITGAWAGFTYKDRVVPGSGNKYFTASGTSAATPHVSAAAALMKCWYPLATNLELRGWLREHARDI